MPGNAGLNVNRGARIKVRLRQPGDKGSFLPYNSILGTLLHELVHNEIGCELNPTTPPPPGGRLLTSIRFHIYPWQEPLGRLLPTT